MTEVTYDTFVPKTLLERAKPELLKAMAQYSVDFPMSADLVKKELETNHFVYYVSWGTIFELGKIARMAKLEFDISFPWSLFREP